MSNLDSLLFKREQFPISIYEATGHKENKFWTFDKIIIPPYHPSMLTEGIDYKSVPQVLNEVVDATVKDLEGVADKIESIKINHLNKIVKDAEGVVIFKPQFEQNDKSIKIESIPIVDRLYVGKDGLINSSIFGSDHYISILPERAGTIFSVPKKVKFTLELMKEYGIKKEGTFLDKKEFKCPYLWYRHNLDDIDAIFYKNLVISLDNEIIKRRYT